MSKRNRDKGKMAEYQRAWREKHRERAREQNRLYVKRNPIACANSRLNHRYGLTLKKFQELHEKQGGICPICLTKPDRGLCVDHDHDSKMFRGLVCKSCNIEMGYFYDNPEALEAAAIYLRSWHDEPIDEE
jgi:hypothetical protein